MWFVAVLCSAHLLAPARLAPHSPIRHASVGRACLPRISMCSSKRESSSGLNERERLDDEEAALRKAIEELAKKPRDASKDEYQTELRSGTLQDVERLSLEVRSFVPVSYTHLTLPTILLV